MLDNLVYEWKIQRLLKKISKQRVTMILQPGDVKVVERSIGQDENTLTLIYTAEFRGWVELLRKAVPSGNIGKNGEFDFDRPSQSKVDYWRLTDSGWAAIQRRHQITLLGTLIGLLGLYLTTNP